LDFKFIHTADIHLDSPLVGLEWYDGAPVEQIRGATRKAFQNLINLAIEEEVSFLMIAGDLYDGDWKDHNTGLFFTSQMAKLKKHGIPVFIVSGNHDAASRIIKHLPKPGNVKTFSTKKPESIRVDGIDVIIHGQGYDTQAVTSDLSLNYPEPDTNLFNIGMLHTSVNGREGHEPYAPCALQGLISKGYDYWALGHVHKREELHREPWILFPGNIQGRHIKETGEKGCSLVTVQDGNVISLDHKNLDVLRWSTCNVDVGEAESRNDVVNYVENSLAEELAKHDSPLLSVRIKVTGACKAHEELISNVDQLVNDIRAVSLGLSEEGLWIENVIVETKTRIDIKLLETKDDAIGGLLRSIKDYNVDEQLPSVFVEEFKALYNKLPVEYRTRLEFIDLKHPETYRKALDGVKDLLLANLLSINEDL